MQTDVFNRRRQGRPRSEEDLRPQNIYLGSRQRSALEARADADGITVSEAARRMIDEAAGALEVASTEGA
jgi:hypothetical protein